MQGGNQHSGKFWHAFDGFCTTLALVMPELELAAAREQVEAIRAAIARYPWDALQPGLTVTISFGVADSREAEGVDQLLALADRRLYASKAAGRNRVTP